MIILHNHKKAKKLVSEIPNLAVVESVDSFKLAKKLNDACDKVYDSTDKKLKIYLQVNTSSEDSK
jgi:PLP dependent protein